MSAMSSTPRAAFPPQRATNMPTNLYQKLSAESLSSVGPMASFTGSLVQRRVSLPAAGTHVCKAVSPAAWRVM